MTPLPRTWTLPEYGPTATLGVAGSAGRSAAGGMRTGVRRVKGGVALGLLLLTSLIALVDLFLLLAAIPR